MNLDEYAWIGVLFAAAAGIYLSMPVDFEE